jgi:hypothetical protein
MAPVSIDNIDDDDNDVMIGDYSFGMLNDILLNIL